MKNIRAAQNAAAAVCCVSDQYTAVSLLLAFVGRKLPSPEGSIQHKRHTTRSRYIYILDLDVIAVCAAIDITTAVSSGNKPPYLFLVSIRSE